MEDRSIRRMHKYVLPKRSIRQDRYARATTEMEALDDKIDASMARRVEVDAHNDE